MGGAHRPNGAANRTDVSAGSTPHRLRECPQLSHSWRITGHTEAIWRWSERELRDQDCRQKNHLCFSPVVFPFYAYLEVLRQSSAACKALQILKRGVLKRLASAVQLRTWPPSFQSVSSDPNLKSVPFRSKIKIQACRSLPRIFGNFFSLVSSPSRATISTVCDGCACLGNGFDASGTKVTSLGNQP